MAARDDVLRRLGALVAQNQAPTAPPPPLADGVPSEEDRVPSEGAASVVVPFTPELQKDASADTEMGGDNTLSNRTSDLVKPLVKAWLTTNMPQSLDDSIREAVKPLLTNWMDVNLPRRVDSAMRELFEPLMVAWLDRNLAPAIERSALQEIARLTGKTPTG